MDFLGLDVRSDKPLKFNIDTQNDDFEHVYICLYVILAIWFFLCEHVFLVFECCFGAYLSYLLGAVPRNIGNWIDGL